MQAWLSNVRAVFGRFLAAFLANWSRPEIYARFSATGDGDSAALKELATGLIDLSTGLVDALEDAARTCAKPERFSATLAAARAMLSHRLEQLATVRSTSNSASPPRNGGGGGRATGDVSPAAAPSPANNSASGTAAATAVAARQAAAEAVTELAALSASLRVSDTGPLHLPVRGAAAFAVRCKSFG